MIYPGFASERNSATTKKVRINAEHRTVSFVRPSHRLNRTKANRTTSRLTQVLIRIAPVIMLVSSATSPNVLLDPQALEADVQASDRPRVGC